MKIITALLVLLLSIPALASKTTFGNVTVSAVTTIYDGDTFTATIDSWPPLIGKSISVRIHGIDTPEMRGKCRQEIELAREAKKATVEMIRAAQVIELRNMRRDKYFRILADAYVDGESIGDTLIGRGLAVPYKGGKKIDWCTTSPPR
jgi:micrococcal nuclease